MPTLVACSFEFLSCGDAVVETNENAGSYIGNPSGDRRFMVVATERMAITATTCLLDTQIGSQKGGGTDIASHVFRSFQQGFAAHKRCFSSFGMVSAF